MVPEGLTGVGGGSAPCGSARLEGSPEFIPCIHPDDFGVGYRGPAPMSLGFIHGLVLGYLSEQAIPLLCEWYK